jgi:hypothetical protein
MKMLKRVLSTALVFCCVALSFRDAPAAETRVTPSIAVQGRYDDNIFFESTDTREDYILTVTPGLTLSQATEQLNAGLRLSFPIIRYNRYDELDATDQTYAGNLGYYWSPRFSSSLTARYDVDSQPGRDIIETGLVIGDTTRRRLSAGLSGEYLLSEATSAGLGYTYSEEKYKSDRFTDIESHNLYLTVTRDMQKILSNTHARVTLAAGRYEFTGSTVDNYSAMVGAVRRLTELYSLSADIGARYTRSEFETQTVQLVGPDTFRVVTARATDDSVGTVGRAALTYQGEATRASLSFFRDIATSGGRAGTVERTAVVLDLGKRFTYKLWGHFSAGYYLNESKGRQLALQDIDQETWRFSPYLRYYHTRHLTLDLSYSHATIDNRVADTRADRNLVLLRVSYAHPLLD